MSRGRDWEAGAGRAWAEMYRETDRSFAGLTQRLLESIAAMPGEAVLDIGCGAGEVTLAVARSRPRAAVRGLDVSPDLVTLARGRGGRHANLRFELGDAAVWQEPGFAPDLLVSRHGVMFFPDPVAAFGHLRAQAAPGAGMVFSCFRAFRDNPWVAEMPPVLPGRVEAPDPQAPGPFAFADPHRLRQILAQAGWETVDQLTVDYAFVAGQGPDPVGDALRFFSVIGPAAAPLAELAPDEREAAEARLRGWLEAHCANGIVGFPAAAWIVIAQRD